MAEKVEYDIVVNAEDAKTSLDSFALKIGASSAGFSKLVDIASDAFRAIKDFAVSSVAEFAESEMGLAKLEAVLRSTGGAAGYTVDELSDMASELQQITTYSDDTTIAAMAVLATFKEIGRETFPQAIKAAQDISTVMGTDLQSSVVMLGKALNEPVAGIGALRRVGIQLTDDQEKMIEKLMETNDVLGAQKIILGEVKAQFGGAAEAAGKTMYGALEQLKGSFSDLKETIGELLSESLRPAIDALREWISLITGAIKGQATLSDAIANQGKYASISTQQLNNYATAVRGQISLLKTQIENDASGILSSSLGKELEKYEDMLRRIDNVLARRGERSGEVPLTRTAPKKTSTSPGLDEKDLLGITRDLSYEYLRLINNANLFKGSMKLSPDQIDPYIRFGDALKDISEKSKEYVGIMGAETSDLLGLTGDFADEYLNVSKNAEFFKESMKLSPAQTDQYIKFGEELDTLAEKSEKYTKTFEEEAYKLSDALTNINASMEQIVATAFVDTMTELGASIYQAGLSTDSLGEALANMSLQILNALPQMFLQAGLMAIAYGNIPLGLALIAMGGISGLVSGAVTAAAEDQSKTVQSQSVSESKTIVNVENNSGAVTETRETTLPDGTKVVDVIVGKVATEMARGGFDEIMRGRYGLSYQGVRR